MVTLWYTTITRSCATDHAQITWHKKCRKSLLGLNHTGSMHKHVSPIQCFLEAIIDWCDVNDLVCSTHVLIVAGFSLLTLIATGDHDTKTSAAWLTAHRTASSQPTPRPALDAGSLSPLDHGVRGVRMLPAACACSCAWQCLLCLGEGREEGGRGRGGGEEGGGERGGREGEDGLVLSRLEPGRKKVGKFRRGQSIRVEQDAAWWDQIHC